MTIPAGPHTLGQTATDDNSKPVICTHAGSPGNFDTNWGSLVGVTAEILTGTTDADATTQVPYAATPQYGFTAEIEQSNGVIRIPGDSPASYEFAVYYWPAQARFELSGVGAQLQNRPYRILVYKMVAPSADWPIYQNPAVSVPGIVDTLFGQWKGKDVYKACIEFPGRTSTGSNSFGPNPMLEGFTGLVNISFPMFGTSYSNIESGIFEMGWRNTSSGRISNLGAQWLMTNDGGLGLVGFGRVFVRWIK